MTESARLLAWVDAQLPPSLARWLTQYAGIEAHHVSEFDLLTAEDPVIFDVARAKHVDVIVTKDDDFVILLDRHGPPPQVVWVTCGNIRNQELRELMLSAWPRVEALLRAGEPLVEIRRA